MSPAECEHRQSFHYHLDTPDGTLYRIECVSCGLKGEWGELLGARAAFNLLAERLKVEAIAANLE